MDDVATANKFAATVHDGTLLAALL